MRRNELLPEEQTARLRDIAIWPIESILSVSHLSSMRPQINAIWVTCNIRRIDFLSEMTICWAKNKSSAYRFSLWWDTLSEILNLFQKCSAHAETSTMLSRLLVECRYFSYFSADTLSTRAARWFVHAYHRQHLSRRFSLPSKLAFARALGGKWPSISGGRNYCFSLPA